MKIIFFGSSDFAVPVLEAVKDTEETFLVVTQPDRKKGRFLKVHSTPVKEAAKKLGIKTFHPENVNSRDSMEYLKKFNADIFVVVSFGQILCGELLDIPKILPLNVHASLLPKYRGAAPINWAIANGEKETGVAIIKMNEKMDEGDIVSEGAVSIAGDEDAIMLSERLSKKGAELLLNSIDLIKRKEARFRSQDNNRASYAPKLKKQDGLIDWRWEAHEIYNRIRAFVPWPGCFTHWNKKILKIWKAMPDSGPGTKDVKPGTVLEASKDSILVGAGKSAIRILELQVEGKRRMNVGDFIAGHREMKSGVNLTNQSLTKVSS
ncbi:methionyl-tRNA formyltransferase [Candidatus Omnitrophota bacterium]